MRLVKAALELPIEVGAALLASAEGYTPRATKLIDEARERLGSIQEIALALADNLPAPKQQPGKSRRRRRRKRKKDQQPAAAGGREPAEAGATSDNGAAPTPEVAAQKPKPRRRRRKPAAAAGGGSAETPAAEA